MADKTQINLERIRACDAEWEESKHPRSENGQFTSGSGAHVSKIQSGGKAKASSIKAGEIAKNQERYDNAHKSMAANYLSDLTNAVKGGDYETAREKLERHEKDKKRYDQLTAQNNKFKSAKKTLEKARPGIAKMREQAKAAGGKPSLQRLQQAMHSGSMMGDRAELHIDGQDYVKIGKDKWEHHPSNSRVLGGTFSSQQMMDIINKAKKVDLNEPDVPAKPAAAPAAKKADANKAAKEQIFKQAAAASKKTAEAKAAKEAAAAKKTLSDIDSRIAEAKRKGDVKSVSFLEAAKASAQKKAPAAKPAQAAKNNGGLEDYKYKPPSKLEGFPIVMASKKTNSGLGGGNRFKFGFKKYKDGIMIRYVDDYWDASDYAFVPLKNPTLENAYSYSDKASRDTVSALKDSLVTNEELGKIARQLK